jgi:hypothetical protein
MSDRDRQSGWRATAFAAALFAITLNFLQPLLHAALMRDGGMQWSAFCNATPEQRQDAPAAADKHECCLGLAHATPFAPPAAIARLVAPPPSEATPLVAFDRPASVGTLDGPHRPRGPPAFV